MCVKFAPPSITTAMISIEIAKKRNDIIVVARCRSHGVRDVKLACWRGLRGCSRPNNLSKVAVKTQFNQLVIYFLN